MLAYLGTIQAGEVARPKLLLEAAFNARIDGHFSISGLQNSKEYISRCRGEGCDYVTKNSLRARRVAHLLGRSIPTEGLGEDEESEERDEGEAERAERWAAAVKSRVRKQKIR